MTATRYNPNNPTVAGSEWFPSATNLRNAGPNFSPGIIIPSTAGESIDQISAFVTPQLPIRDSSRLACEVYDLTALGGLDWVTSDIIDRRTIAPAANANVPGAGQFVKVASAVETTYDTSAWQNIDDAISDADAATTGNTDSIRYKLIESVGAAILFGGGSTFKDGGTGASASNLSGRRIAAVEIVVSFYVATTAPVTIWGAFNLDGDDYYVSPEVISAAGWKRIKFTVDYDPRTNLRWTNTDAQTLVSSATNYFGVRVQGTAGTGHVDISAVGLTFYTVTERRVATATALLVATPGWLAMPCRALANDAPANWSKTNAHSYLIAFHVSANTRAPALGGVDTSLTAGHETDVALFATQDLSAVHGTVPSALPASGNALASIACVLGSTASVDSQPYAAALAYQVGGASAHVLRQRISTEGAATYGTATVLVQTTASGQVGVVDQDAALTVTLKKVSDNSVLMAATSILPADVPPDGKFHPVQLAMPHAVLTAALAVYLELASTSTVAWNAVGPRTRAYGVPSDAAAVAAAAASIGGTTDLATVDGTTDSTLDFPWSIGTVPTAPSVFAPALTSFANRQGLTGTAAIPTITGIALSWSPTSLGAAFGYYELQRANLTTLAWESIAQITDESNPYFNDFEQRRNAVAALYRVRVVRADGQISDWTSFAASPKVTTPDACDLILTSNFAPDLTVACQDLEGYTYKASDQAAIVVHRIAGRKFPVQFTPSDGRADVFTRTLMLAANDPNISNAPTGLKLWAGRGVFDAILALARSTAVPYVALCDGRDHVWYCGIQVGDMIENEPNGIYTAQVTFTEVTDVPAVWIGALPPVTPP